jgi:hypothetical protein
MGQQRSPLPLTHFQQYSFSPARPRGPALQLPPLLPPRRRPSPAVIDPGTPGIASAGGCSPTGPRRQPPQQPPAPPALAYLVLRSPASDSVCSCHLCSTRADGLAPAVARSHRPRHARHRLSSHRSSRQRHRPSPTSSSAHRRPTPTAGPPADLGCGPSSRPSSAPSRPSTSTSTVGGIELGSPGSALEAWPSAALRIGHSNLEPACHLWFEASPIETLSATYREP